jgi:hypothetical protein
MFEGALPVAYGASAALTKAVAGISMRKDFSRTDRWNRASAGSRGDLGFTWICRLAIKSCELYQ